MPYSLKLGLGFSTAQAQCLVAPPYAAAGIVMFAESWICDKYRFRGPCLIFNSIIALIGLPLIGFHSNSSVRYFGIFLATVGVNANVPAIMTFQANNVVGQWKRAFSSASLVGFGGIGGIAGSLVFRSQDAPGYLPGLYAAMACSGLVIFCVCVLDTIIYFENKKQTQGKILENTVCLANDPSVIRHSLTFVQEGFRYTY
jgi:hypothetical protein